MRDAIGWHLERLSARYGADFPLRNMQPLAAAQAPAQAQSATTTQSPSRPAQGRTGRPPREAPIRPEIHGFTPPRRGAKPAAPEAPPIPRAADLDAFAAALADCTRCKLSEQRKQVVFGEGNPAADLMFVGEAPGAQEDRLGRPFVGPAGQLLDRIIENAMGLQRADVYIANINKCRPPGNRNPEPDEVAACLPLLARQIELVQPKVLVALGRVAAANLLGSSDSVTRLRGRALEAHGVPVVVTWHPAYLLRNPSAKRETWEDIKRVNRLLGLPEVPPPRTGS